MIWDSQRDELIRFPNRVFAGFPYIRNNLHSTILIQTHTNVPHLAYRPTVDRTGLLTQYDKCDNAAWQYSHFPCTENLMIQIFEYSRADDNLIIRKETLHCTANIFNVISTFFTCVPLSTVIPLRS